MYIQSRTCPTGYRMIRSICFPTAYISHMGCPMATSFQVLDAPFILMTMGFQTTDDMPYAAKGVL